MNETVLHAESLTYGYRKGAAIIDNLDTAVPSGVLTSITGPSGRGKSTLLYLFAGLLTPWSGLIYFDGDPQQNLPDSFLAEQRAHSFGFVFQDVVLDPRRTIMDAVLEPCLYARVEKRDYRDRASELLDLLGVKLQSFSRPGEISGGQAQRVGVCRALLMEPRVIFADEPTGNLDSESADAVISALESAAAGGAAVLIATHDDRVMERCGNRIQL